MSPSRELGPFGVAVAQNGGKLLGSGAVVARGLVLTAWHVVEGKRDLVVRRGGSDIAVDEVLPEKKPTHDVALLRVSVSDLPVASIHDRAIGAEAFEADGYPKVVDGDPSTLLEQVKGTTCRCGVADTTLNLDVDGPPVWRGLSGAAVRIGGRIVAVVRGARDDWAHAGQGTRRITATPLAIVWRDEAWFRAALVDRRKLDEDYQAWRAAVRDQIAAALADDGALGRALAVELGCAPTVVPDSLLDAPGCDAALALANAISDAPGGRCLWTSLLPVMLDLRPLALEVAEALRRGQRQLELSWREESLAEVVFAAAERRACRLVPHARRERALWGEGFLPLPQALEQGVLRTTPASVESLVKAELESLEANLMEAFGAADRDLLNQQVRTRSKLRSAPTPRLILVDAELGDLAPEVWRITCQAALPDLHLLRLKGGLSAEQFEEGTLHELLRNLHQATAE